MPTVLQIVHGFPPRELAGTELATARLVEGLGARGWRCHVLAATRAPGLDQYAVLRDEPGITRVVNNLPFRPLGRERDIIIEGIIQRELERVRPDIVHIQHLAHLSSGLRFELPAVGTLHDHWPWCPAGGTMLRPDGVPCPTPDPEVCAVCYAHHARLPGRLEHAAVGLATAVSRFVSPTRLHAHWRRLPTGLRALLQGSRTAPGNAAGAASRRRALTEAWNALDRRMAPSAFLAGEAQHHGLGAVAVVPSGVATTHPRIGGGPLLYLGSILPHKGVHIVVQAYRAAFGGPAASPGLLLHGDHAADPSYARSLDWPLAGRLDPASAPPLLARAMALVMGSTWPENAPLVCLEARASGCPVVAPRIGGIPELVHDGVDGYLYEPGDVEDLERCLRRVAGPEATALAVRPPPTLAEHAERVEAIYLSAMNRTPSQATPRSEP